MGFQRYLNFYGWEERFNNKDTHYYLVHNSEKLKTTQGPDGIMQRLKMMQKDI